MIISYAPNWTVIYDRNYYDRETFIVQATEWGYSYRHRHRYSGYKFIKYVWYLLANLASIWYWQYSIKMTGILISEDDLPIGGDCSLDELHTLPM
jgi:hypothetical protein